MTEVWTVVHNERRHLIDDLERITPEKWDTTSLCDGWTIHDVLAHLVDDAKTTKSSFIRKLILAGFNFDKLNQRGVERERKATGEETLSTFREVRLRTTSAPAATASRLVEIIVHGEDIRRPLGIRHTYPIEAISQAMEYQLATSDSMGGSKDRAAGLQLVSTDADWTHGTGAEVRGTSIDLLMALTGRNVPNEALSGDGIDTLRSRRR